MKFKIKLRKEYLFFIIGLLPSLFIYIYYFSKGKPIFVSQSKNSLFDPVLGLPGEAQLPEVILDQSQLKLKDEALVEIEKSPKLKIISAKALPVVEQVEGGENKVTGIRVVGEFQNQGQETVLEVKPIVKFYEKGTLVATKIANWASGYQFLPLSSGERSIFDILIPNPPQSEHISTNMRIMETDKSGEEGVDLKVKDKGFEEESIERGEEKMAYFKFTGKLFNPHDYSVENPGIMVWLKDDQGQIIASSYKIFEAELIESNQEIEVSTLLIPFDPGSGKVFSHEVRTYGEKL